MNISPYFPYVFPVITLILGVVLNRFADSFIERRKMKKKGKRWVGELQFLKKPIEKQIEALDEFLIEHNKDRFSTPSVTGFVLMKTDRFKSLDRMDFLRYMEHRFCNEEKAIEKTNEVLGMVEVIDTYAKRIETVFNTYLNNASGQFAIWNTSLNEFIRKSADLRTEGEKQGVDFSKDKLLNPIFQITKKEIFDKRDAGIELELFNWHKEFLCPILTICELERHDDRTNQLRPFLTQCHDSVEKIRMEKLYLSDNIKNIREATLKAKEKLSSLVTEIKN